MFNVTPTQEYELKKWLKKVRKKAAKISPDPVIKGAPYYGAIGGGLTYCFTPTGVGVFLTVKEAITGEEIDLTDYDII